MRVVPIHATVAMQRLRDVDQSRATGLRRNLPKLNGSSPVKLTCDFLLALDALNRTIAGKVLVVFFVVVFEFVVPRLSATSLPVEISLLPVSSRRGSSIGPDDGSYMAGLKGKSDDSFGS